MHNFRRGFGWRPGALAKGTLAMTVGMGLRTVGQAAVFLVVARMLGVEAYGAYSAVLALAMTFGGFAGFGASVIMLRDTARDGTAFAESWGRTLASLYVTTPLLLFAYLTVAWAVLSSQVASSVIVCVGLAEVIFAPLAFASMQAYQGHDRIGRAASLILAPILPRLFAALLSISISIAQPGIPRLSMWAILYLMAAVVTAGYALRRLQHDFGVSYKPFWSGLICTLREGWPFSTGGAMHKVYVDIDKVMLARLSTLEVTGAYSASYRVMDMLNVPLLSFISAAESRFFRAGSLGTLGAARYALRVLPVPMIYAVVAGAVIYLFAGVLPCLLGHGFESAVDMLRWLAWLPLLITPRYFMHTTLSVSGRQYITVLIVACGALLNVATNIWAIPRWGWGGAVAATYFSECVMNILLLEEVVRHWRFGGKIQQ